MLPQQVAISSQVLFEQLKKESVLLNMGSESYFGLDEIGTFWWKLLTIHNGQTQPIISTTLEEYEVDEATVSAELEIWLKELRQHQIVAF
jgi:hypothetical protein